MGAPLPISFPLPPLIPPPPLPPPRLPPTSALPSQLHICLSDRLSLHPHPSSSLEEEVTFTAGGGGCRVQVAAVLSWGLGVETQCSLLPTLLALATGE